MTTVQGKLIGPPDPTRVQVTAQLVDLAGERTLGFVASVPGEIIGLQSNSPESDGSWSLDLTPNADIEADAGDTLWKITEGRALDGTPIVTYVAVPASGGPYWMGDIRTALPGQPNGNPATYGVLSVNAQTGAVGLDAEDVGADPAGSASSAQSAAAAALETHAADTTSVHGIPDTTVLETQSGAQGRVDTHTSAVDPHGDRAYADGKLTKTANLSDLPSPSAARTSLGLGTAATRGVGSSSGTVAAGDDARLSDARTPTSHAASHASGSTDPVTPAAIGALPVSGGTVSGRLVVDKFGAPAYPIGQTGSVASLDVPSSYTGGDDNGSGTDTTGRINLYSYQRANVGSFGENIRNFAMRSDAKTMQAFYVPVQSGTKKGGYDPSTRDPLASGIGWKPVVWQGAHYEANDHASIHGHWELEIADLNGALQGRLEIPFIDQDADSTKALDQAAIGVAYTNIRTNLADFSVRAQNMTAGPYSGQNTALRVGGNNSVNKELHLSISSGMGTAGRRWVLRANTTSEAGSNAGTDFQLLAYDDTGALITQALHAERKTGNVGFGTTTPDARVHVKRATGQVLHLETGATTQSAMLVDGFDATVKAVQGQVAGDTAKRFQLLVDGSMSWGTGSSSTDTTLYRAAAGRLKTDGSLHTGTNLLINTTSVGAGAGVLGVADATTAPSTTPTGGGVLYSASGLPRWKGSDGVDYDLAHGQMPLTVVRKTADETVTSSITVQDDDHLVAAVAANSIYMMEAFLIYDGDTAGDLRVTFTGPSGAAMDWTPNGASTSQASGTGSIKLERQPLGQESTLGSSGAGVKSIAMPRGVLTTSSTSGSLTLRWAQATSSTTATTLFANSLIRLTKIG